MLIFTTQPSFSGRANSIVVAAVIVVMSGFVTTQLKADGNDLRTLRASFRQGLLSAILPEKRAYAARLLGLEKKLVSARDYADAIKVREERITLEQELAAFELELPALVLRASGKSALLPERVVFNPKDATLSGVKLDSDGAIIGWGTAGSAALWNLPHLPEGGYEVMVKYTCAGGGSATLEVRENFYALQSKVTLAAGKQVEKNLGTLRIRNGDGKLMLVANGASQSAQFCVVKLELAPVNR